MARVQFTAPALRDIRAIHSYIAGDSPDRAVAFVERVRARCAVLERHPLSGRPRPEFSHVDPGMRSWAVKPVVVFYRFVGARDVVEILRVIDGRRDLGTIFEDDL